MGDTAESALDSSLAAGDERRSRRLVRQCVEAAGVDEVFDCLARHAAGGSMLATELLVEAVDASGVARRFVAGLLLDEWAIDEVSQDTLVTVAKAVGTFKGDARFTTWLHTVARNRAVDHLRRQRAVLPLEAIDHGPAARMSSIIATRETVRHVLARIPEQYRQAVTLRDVEGLPYEQVAETLGRNVNTVKSQVARGRALVAAMLDESDGM